MSRTAMVLGASGLIGSHMLEQILDQPGYRKVRALVRNPVPVEHPNLEQHRVDFDRLSDYRDLFQVDDLFCCLGTTIARAGSREAFRKVDLDYPLEAGRLAQDQGVRQYVIVTAMGADTKSAFFYNRVKGEVEQGLEELNLPVLLIFRPSLLLGERKERRLGEHLAGVVGRVLTPLMVGPLFRYRPIEGRAVAVAMNRMARQGLTGLHVFESDRIAALAR